MSGNETRQYLIWLVCIGFALAAALETSAMSRSDIGEIRGSIKDDHGRPIVGVDLQLTGSVRSIATTSADGSFHLGSLPSGRYTLIARATGFENVVMLIDLRDLLSASVVISMQPKLSESITVSTGPVIVDEVEGGDGIVADQYYFRLLPSLHDPWSVLRSVPGTFLNRLNVGGGETGEQAFAVSRGATSDQSSFSIDGVAVTDMLDAGMAPMYFDFEHFGTVEVRTGGAHPQIQTPGIQVNLMTKEPFPRLTGSARTFFSNDDLQSPSVVPERASPYLTSGSSIDRITDYGFELGGPLWKELASGWFGWSDKKYALLSPTYFGREQSTDVTTFQNLSAKLSISGKRSFGSLFYISSNHERHGEGTGVRRPIETSYHRSAPGELLKIDATTILSPTMFVSAQLSSSDFSLRLDPLGGETDMMVGGDGNLSRSYYFFETSRPQKTGSASVSAVLAMKDVQHQIVFGGGYREAGGTDRLRAPGSGTIADLESSDLFARAVITRPSHTRVDASYAHLFASDRIDWRNLSFDVGVRWDEQSGRNLASEVPANELFPDLLPAAAFVGDERPLVWRSLAPRIAVHYSPQELPQASFRVGYNRYYDQLSAGEIARGGPFHDLQALHYSWIDWNRDQFVQPDEISGRPFFWSGVIPDDPSSALPTSRFDYGTRPPVTDEIFAGVDVNLGLDWFVSLQWMERRKKNLIWLRPEKISGGADFYSSSDFELAGVLTGQMPNLGSYEEPYFRLKAGVPAPTFFVLTNRPEYEQHYSGIDFITVKRFSNRSAFRFYLHINDWTQDVGDEAYSDPTRMLSMWGCNRCDGAAVVESSDRRFNSKEDVYVNAGWSSSLTGIYQLPWGFTFAATMFARQGYPIPYYRRVFTDDGTERRDVLVADVDAVRLPWVLQLDLRLTREIELSSRVNFLGSVDVFNASNEQNVLARQARLSSTGTLTHWDNRIVELQSPTVFRIGARFSF
jgi:hypothetical protein